jgi:hypothetical protein
VAIAALQTILDPLDSWPPEQQERAAELLASLETRQRDDDWQVSDEDLVEIDRRLADPDAPSISLEEFDRRFARWLR